MMLSMARRKSSPLTARSEHPFPIVKPRKRLPHEFVLEALAGLAPRTNPMFGCLAVYVGEKIVLILRDKRDHTAADDGVWLATSKDHHESICWALRGKRTFAASEDDMKTGPVLPASPAVFESAALCAC